MSSNKYCINCEYSEIILMEAIYREGVVIDTISSNCKREASNLVTSEILPIRNSLSRERINGYSMYGENCGIDAKYFEAKKCIS